MGTFVPLSMKMAVEAEKTDHGQEPISDAGPMPRTADRIASELHEELRSAGEKPPYILVGTSFGGYLVRGLTANIRMRSRG
jgi:thioesterase domain-containing protein